MDTHIWLLVEGIPNTQSHTNGSKDFRKEYLVGLSRYTLRYDPPDKDPLSTPTRVTTTSSL